jgi:uncharacterized protein
VSAIIQWTADTEGTRLSQDFKPGTRISGAATRHTPAVMKAPGKTAFWDAVKNHRAEDVAAALKARPDLASLIDSSGRTPLHFCAQQKASTPARARASIATARALVRAGADVHAIRAKRDDGEIFPATVLWHALALGRNIPLARHFLKLKVDPNHCMFALVWADDVAAAKLLRRHGARLDELGHGETPLIWAVRLRRVQFAQWLLREGADASIADPRGFTALHHAVRRRLPDSTLQLLVRSGARADATVAALATRAQRKLLGI